MTKVPQGLQNKPLQRPHPNGDGKQLPRAQGMAPARRFGGGGQLPGPSKEAWLVTTVWYSRENRQLVERSRRDPRNKTQSSGQTQVYVEA